MYGKSYVKRLCSFLVLIFALSVLVSGCGQKAAEGDNTGSNATIQQEEPALQTTAKDELKPVTLKWYYESAKPKDAEEVFVKANEIVKKTINATIDFQPIDWGTFDQKVPLIIASGEEFDILFSASWVAGSRYGTNAAKGSIIPVDELLDKYAPLTKKMIPQNIWDGCKIQGKIYGVPNYQIMATSGGMGLNKELCDKYGIDPTKIKCMADLEPAFETIKKNEPGIAALPAFPGCSVWSGDNYIDKPVREVDYIGVNKDLKVVCLYDDQAFVDNWLKKAREYYLKGYFPKDVATAKDPSYNDALKAGKVFSAVGGYKPGGEADYSASYGRPFYSVPLDTYQILSTPGITATMNCISKTSKNPERAMMFLEQISQNKELYNTIVFGIEGKHYNKVSDNRIEIVKDPGYSASAWMMGNQFLAYLQPGQPDDVWQQTMDLNNTAIKSYTCGFTFDSEPVKTEMANCNAITTECQRVANAGLMEPDKYIAQYKDKFEKAGVKKIMDELQKQLDAWKAGE